MVSYFSLLSNLLLASVAASSSSLEAALADRHENRQLKPINLVSSPSGASANISYTANFAGAVWTQVDGSFITVTAAITVPNVSGNNSGAVAFVGIDGLNECDTQGVIRGGIDFRIIGGNVSYFAWGQSDPDYHFRLYDLAMKAGDVIRIIVTADSATSGMIFIQNEATGRVVWEEINPLSHALCRATVGWIVSIVDGSSLPLAEFSPVLFHRASAADTIHATFSPDGAALLDIQQDNVTLTSVSASGHNLTVKYLKDGATEQ